MLPGTDLVAVSLDRLEFYNWRTLRAVGATDLPASGSLAFTLDGALAYAPLPSRDAVAVLEMKMAVSSRLTRDGASKRISLSSKETLRLTILGEPECDAALIDAKSVRLAGAAPLRSAIGHFPDPVDSDGVPDLILDFQVKDLRLKPGDTEARVQGAMTYGVRIEAVVKVQIEP